MCDFEQLLEEQKYLETDVLESCMSMLVHCKQALDTLDKHPILRTYAESRNPGQYEKLLKDKRKYELLFAVLTNL